MTDENQDSFDMENHDVFDDTSEETISDGDGGSAGEEASQGSEDKESEPEGKTEGEEDKSEDETGAKEDTDGTPPEGKEGDDDQSGKMIPEHRFKAALKDVNDKLDAANAELAKAKAKPPPNPEEDPEGYNFHLRMETSKDVMRATTDDYDAVIAHYGEMVKTNPYLNEAVAAHPSPAKHAYDIAKKDMEIRELQELKSSDEFKEFQEFKKQKAKQAKEDEAKAKQEQKEQEKEKSKAPDVPNLNRATDVGQGKQEEVDDTEELFAGSAL